jgi:hypothetical protein
LTFRPGIHSSLILRLEAGGVLSIDHTLACEHAKYPVLVTSLLEILKRFGKT